MTVWVSNLPSVSMMNRELTNGQGISDKYSWIPETFRGEGAGLLWDEKYNKKSAYGGFLKGIKKGKK